MKSRYELLFEALLQEAGVTDYVAEYRFDVTRRWRFDFAWPALKLAVEIDGGQWAFSGGRHNSDADRNKCNTALTQGWRVLRFSGTQVTDGPATCIAFVRMML